MYIASVSWILSAPHFHELQGNSSRVLQVRWLHETRGGSFQAAASSLRDLAWNQGNDASLEDLERLACLSKLATLATQPPGSFQLPEQVADISMLPLLAWIFS